MSESNRHTRLLPQALVLLVWPMLLFFPSHQGEFASDDYRFIVDNRDNLSHWSSPWIYFTDAGTNADRDDADIYRPLRTWSFALDHRLFGLEPLGYHLHNVLLHGLVGILLLLLLRGLEPIGAFGAFVGAVLFVSHPITTEAVCWISSRSDLHAALLVLAALLAARRAESRRVALAWAVPLGLLAGFAKETAVVAPALYLIDHLLRRGRLQRDALAPFLALSIGAGLYLAVYLTVRDRGLGGQVAYYGGSLASHLPFGLVGLARMLRLCLLPTGLDFMWETNLFDPLALSDILPAAAGLGLSGLLLILCWRHRPALACGLLWFFVAVLPASNLFLPLRTLLAERFAYLPLVGVILALAGLLSRLGRSAAGLCAVLLLLPLATLTWDRAGDWRTQERLYEASLELHPGSFAAHYGLGGVLLEKANGWQLEGKDQLATPALRAARGHFQAATRIAADDPVRSVDAMTAQGRVLLLLHDWHHAVDMLSEVVRRLEDRPDLASLVHNAAGARFDLGLAQTRERQLNAAARTFERLIQVHGETPRRLDALGEVYRALHDRQAGVFYARALELDPDYHDARIHLALYLAELLKLPVEARRELKEVLSRDPNHAKARATLEQLGS